MSLDTGGGAVHAVTKEECSAWFGLAGAALVAAAGAARDGDLVPYAAH
ncbi:MAG: hypothetical protein IRZ09_14300 [Variibacter sp.]|nr:hypothetical protein [Variibacter sp.]